MSENIIKSINPQTCPSCNTIIYVEAMTTPATVTGILSEQDVAMAREAAKAKIGTLGLSPDRAKEALAYVEDEAVTFGVSDIDLILERFIPHGNPS